MGGTNQASAGGDSRDSSYWEVDADGAWAAYQPGGGRPWDLRGAAHLYHRAALDKLADSLSRLLAVGQGS